jgi:hypothetical protein
MDLKKSPRQNQFSYLHKTLRFHPHEVNAAGGAIAEAIGAIPRNRKSSGALWAFD